MDGGQLAGRDIGGRGNRRHIQLITACLLLFSDIAPTKRPTSAGLSPRVIVEGRARGLERLQRWRSECQAKVDRLHLIVWHSVGGRAGADGPNIAWQRQGRPNGAQHVTACLDLVGAISDSFDWELGQRWHRCLCRISSGEDRILEIRRSLSTAGDIRTCTWFIWKQIPALPRASVHRCIFGSTTSPSRRSLLPAAPHLENLDLWRRYRSGGCAHLMLSLKVRKHDERFVQQLGLPATSHIPSLY